MLHITVFIFSEFNCISICNVTLSIVKPNWPRWVNTVPCYCCPFLYLRMCLSTVTERVPLGRAGLEFVPVPGNFLGPRASTGLARFMKFWAIENVSIVSYKVYRYWCDINLFIGLMCWCELLTMFCVCYVYVNWPWYLFGPKWSIKYYY